MTRSASLALVSRAVEEFNRRLAPTWASADPFGKAIRILQPAKVAREVRV